MPVSSEVIQIGLIVIILICMLIYAHINKVSLRALNERIGELSVRLIRSSAPSDSAASDSAVSGASPELLKEIKKYDGHFSTLAKELVENRRVSEVLAGKIAESATRQNGMLGGIRDYLATKNELTGRLQEGYDYRILSNFVKQIIRCISQLDSHLVLTSDPDSTQQLRAIKGDLLDLLDRHGIETITPSPGTSFSELRKVAEVVPHKDETEDENLAGKVSAVIRPGYQYVISHDKHRIIMPAQVKLYELKGTK